MNSDHEESLKPLITDDFLHVLQLAVKTCGWSVDHVESAEFVRWCFYLADKEPPNLDPFL